MGTKIGRIQITSVIGNHDFKVLVQIHYSHAYGFANKYLAGCVLYFHWIEDLAIFHNSVPNLIYPCAFYWQA